AMGEGYAVIHQGINKEHRTPQPELKLSHALSDQEETREPEQRVGTYDQRLETMIQRPQPEKEKPLHRQAHELSRMIPHPGKRQMKRLAVVVHFPHIPDRRGFRNTLPGMLEILLS